MRTGTDPGDTKVCAIGLWHLGCVVSACLAKLGYRVSAYDPRPDRVRSLALAVPPLYEPGLRELTGAALDSGRLSLEDADLPSALAGADFVLLTIDTPVDEDDTADVDGILATAAEIAEPLDDGATIVVMSQVPVGTCHRIRDAIREACPQRRFGLVYSPENLKLGQAIERFLRPPMIILGADAGDAQDAAAALFRPIAAPKVRLDLRTAEMTKHALNAFSATCISFTNELARLCEEVRADAAAMSKAMRYDERVGQETPLQPGLGFSGGTLARDLNALRSVADGRGIGTPLLDAVVATNEKQQGIILDKLHRVHGSLDGLAISVFGLTYKPGTSTLRRSMSLDLIASLASEGSTVRAYDPKADLSEMPSGFPAEVATDPYETVRGSDALVIVTGWPEFSDLDYRAIRGSMRRPVVIDALNMLDRDELLGHGFRYVGIGR